MSINKLSAPFDDMWRLPAWNSSIKIADVSELYPHSARCRFNPWFINHKKNLEKTGIKKAT